MIAGGRQPCLPEPRQLSHRRETGSCSVREAAAAGCEASGLAAVGAPGSVSPLVPRREVTAEVSNGCQEQLSGF